MSINLPLVLDAASQPHGLTDALRRRWRFIGSVFVADLAGWSALCERLTTMEALVKANQTHAYIAAMVGGHGGQVVKTSGDNLFAVFGDAVRAVACGAETIRRLAADGSMMRASAGIAMGEMIVIPGEDLFGAPVNRASRLAEDTAADSELLVDSPVMQSIGRERWSAEPVAYALAGRERDAWKIILS